MEGSTIKSTNHPRISAKTVATVAMLCAIAFVAKLVSKVFPDVAGFLSFDLKDVVIVIGGFILGPLAAVVISVIVSLIEMLSVSTTGPIGLLMNVIASCSFACVAAVIYHRDHSIKGAVIGLIAGVLCMTVMMLLWNWLITPLYMKVPRETVVSMLLPTFLPFNLLKGGMNAALAMLLYKPVVNALRKAHLVPESSAGRRSARWGVVIVSVVLLASFILLALVLAKVI